MSLCVSVFCCVAADLAASSGLFVSTFLTPTAAVLVRGCHKHCWRKWKYPHYANVRLHWWLVLFCKLHPSVCQESNCVWVTSEKLSQDFQFGSLVRTNTDVCLHFKTGACCCCGTLFYKCKVVREFISHIKYDKQRRLAYILKWLSAPPTELTGRPPLIIVFRSDLLWSRMNNLIIVNLICKFPFWSRGLLARIVVEFMNKNLIRVWTGTLEKWNLTLHRIKNGNL